MIILQDFVFTGISLNIQIANYSDFKIIKDNHIFLNSKLVKENSFVTRNFIYVINTNYIKIVSQISYSGEELSGVGGLKMSFDFRNFDCRSIFTPAELEASSSDPLSRDDLGADFARVFLNLS